VGAQHVPHLRVERVYRPAPLRGYCGEGGQQLGPRVVVLVAVEVRRRRAAAAR
jgi:hypothetical protein